MDECAKCESVFSDCQDTVTLRDKGSEGINNANKERGDDIIVKSGQTVHKEVSTCIHKCTQHCDFQKKITRKI